MKTRNAKQTKQAECNHVWSISWEITNAKGEVVKTITPCKLCGWQRKDTK